MKILLDTCTFLWLLVGETQLSETVKRYFVDPVNEVYLSVVSEWEIAVKHSIGRLPLPQDPRRYIPVQRERHGIATLPLDEESSLHITTLPHIHNDPFDRMLISQALIHGMALATPDREIQQYPLRTLWQ